MIASIFYRYDFDVIPFYSLAELNLPLIDNKQIGRMTEIIRVRKKLDDDYNYSKKDENKFNKDFIQAVEHSNVKYYVVFDNVFFTPSFF